MKPDDILDEAREFYPGILALQRQFFPFASDPTGSGDQFFLRCGMTNDRRVFRIYHDCVDLSQNRILDEGIEETLPDLAMLLPFAGSRIMKERPDWQ